MPVAASPLRFSSGALRQMSNTDINDYVSERIGESFASTESTGSLNTSSGTSIGTLSDNYTVINANGVVTGTSKITGESILYQNTTLVTPTTPTRPLKYSDSVGGLQQMSDSDIDTYISAVVAKYIADGGVGSYALGLTAPSDGDTWTSRATITNRRTLQDSTYTGNVTVGYLWQKTASSSVTTKRPVHYDTNVKEMTDVQIQTLTDRVRNEIVNNSIGTYKLATSAPTTGGTWRQCGSGIDDVVTSTYTNVFTGNYTSLYTQQYTSQYTTVWASTFATGYTQGYTTAYTQQYTGEYTTVYGAAVWSGPKANYSGTYTGPTYTNEFTAVYTLTNEYTTVAVYGGAEYTSVYTAPSYTSVYTLVYTTTNDIIFTGAYTTEPSPLVTYAGTYTTVDVVYYNSYYLASWTTGGWTVSWTADALSYATYWTRNWSRLIYYSGIRSFVGYYAGPLNYYMVSYTGVTTIKYTSSLSYWTTQQFTGPEIYQPPVTTVLEYSRQSSGSVYNGYTLTPTDGWTSSPLYFTDQVIFNVWPEDPAIRYTGFVAAAYGPVIGTASGPVYTGAAAWTSTYNIDEAIFAGYYNTTHLSYYTSTSGSYTRNVTVLSGFVGFYSSLDTHGPTYTRTFLSYTDITEKAFTAPPVYTAPMIVDSYGYAGNFYQLTAGGPTQITGGGSPAYVQGTAYASPTSLFPYTGSFTNNYTVGGVYSPQAFSGIGPSNYWSSITAAYIVSYTPGVPGDIKEYQGSYTRDSTDGVTFGDIGVYVGRYTLTMDAGAELQGVVGYFQGPVYGAYTGPIIHYGASFGLVSGAYYSTPLYFTGSHYLLDGEQQFYSRSWTSGGVITWYTRGETRVAFYLLPVYFTAIYTSFGVAPQYYSKYYTAQVPVTWSGVSYGQVGYNPFWTGPSGSWSALISYTGTQHNYLNYNPRYALYNGTTEYPTYTGGGQMYGAVWSRGVGYTYSRTEAYGSLPVYSTGVEFFTSLSWYTGDTGYGGRTPVAYTREYNVWYATPIYYTRGEVYVGFWAGWSGAYTSALQYTRSWTGVASYNQVAVFANVYRGIGYTRDEKTGGLSYLGYTALNAYTISAVYRRGYTATGYTRDVSIYASYGVTRQFGLQTSFARSWTGPVSTYALTVYYGLGYGSFYSRNYIAYTQGSPVSYLGYYVYYYAGFGRSWAGYYTRSNLPIYVQVLPVTYAVSYTGPTYTGAAYTKTYTGGGGTSVYTSEPYTPTLVYSMEYTGTYTSEYSGPEYTNEFASSFQTTYTGGYTGEPTYTSALEYTAPLYTAQYIGAWSIVYTLGPFTQQFTQLYTSVSDVAYAGIYSNVYTQQYTHTTPVLWTSIYANVYTLAVTENYTAAVIDNTYTRTYTTYYLWVRIA